ncbi:MAG: CDP-diacylglycerol--glycerol-3-phosphate 3-phosphatidyltransferase [Actinobacteria bacterium]|nr:CDP-diacylglycerol--glycerol-3-phosphate 3-phosphatidyltransferase [Actinomycetota bacterium]
MNLPNVLTLVRIALVPIVLIALLQETDSGDVIAAWAFAIAAATDWFDGYLARSRNLITTFGKVMDPIADKLLIATTLITLSALGDLSWWATGIVLGREFAVTALRAFVAEDGTVISASMYGKVKTVFQSFTVLVVMLFAPADWVSAMVWAMVGVTVLTGLDYFVNLRKRTDEVAG